MSESDEISQLLEDTRVRVIYYSCIEEPKNILEITQLWNFKTSTYFYQAKSKSLIEKAIKAKLFSMAPGSRYKSNYDLILEKKRVRNYFEKINMRVSNEIIIDKYDYNVTEGQLDDALFREFCIEKKPELKEILDATRIVDEEAEKFRLLWQSPTFKRIFLTADSIRKYVDDRNELPDNPIELLFNFTVNVCDRIYHYKEGGEPSFDNLFSSYWFDISEVLPQILTNIESARSESSEDFKFFAKRFVEVYKIVKKKIAVQEGRSEVSSYHIAKIAEIVGL